MNGRFHFLRQSAVALCGVGLLGLLLGGCVSFHKARFWDKDDVKTASAKDDPNATKKPATDAGASDTTASKVTPADHSAAIDPPGHASVVDFSDPGSPLPPAKKAVKTVAAESASPSGAGGPAAEEDPFAPAASASPVASGSVAPPTNLQAPRIAVVQPQTRQPAAPDMPDPFGTSPLADGRSSRAAAAPVSQDPFAGMTEAQLRDGRSSAAAPSLAATGVNSAGAGAGTVLPSTSIQPPAPPEPFPQAASGPASPSATASIQPPSPPVPYAAPAVAPAPAPTPAAASAVQAQAAIVARRADATKQPSDPFATGDSRPRASKSQSSEFLRKNPEPKSPASVASADAWESSTESPPRPAPAARPSAHPKPAADEGVAPEETIAAESDSSPVAESSTPGNLMICDSASVRGRFTGDQTNVAGAKRRTTSTNQRRPTREGIAVACDDASESCESANGDDSMSARSVRRARNRGQIVNAVARRVAGAENVDPSVLEQTVDTSSVDPITFEGRPSSITFADEPRALGRHDVAHGAAPAKLAAADETVAPDPPREAPRSRSDAWLLVGIGVGLAVSLAVWLRLRPRNERALN